LLVVFNIYQKIMKEKLQSVQGMYTFLWDFYKFIAKFQFMSKEDCDTYLSNNPVEEKFLKDVFDICQESEKISKTLTKIMNTIDLSHKPVIMKHWEPTIIL